MNTTEQGGLWGTALRVVALAMLLEMLLLMASAEQARALPDTREMRKEIVREARTHLGESYDLGGLGLCSRNAVDCECLNRLVYREFDKNLSAALREQASTGEYRSRSEMRRGDLVYFRDRQEGSVYHVGIYSGMADNGDRLVIHASDPRNDVLVSPLEHIRGFSGARDVLGGDGRDDDSGEKHRASRKRASSDAPVTFESLIRRTAD